MALYISFDSKDEDKLWKFAEQMHIGLKGYKPYIDSDIAILQSEDSCEIVLAIGDATAKTDITLTANIDSD